MSEPGQALRLVYHGPARPTTAEELAALPLREKAAELVDFDLTFSGTGAIWDWGARLAAQTGSNFHVEQPGRVSGKIRFGDAELTMAGFAHRDHSRGPRDIGTTVRSHWGQGHFPGGPSFGICQTRNREDGVVRPRLDEAVIFQDGRIIPAKASAVPLLESPFDTPGTEYTLSLESELGTMEIDPELGVRCLMEAPTRYRWNGREGAGWSERGSSFSTPR